MECISFDTLHFVIWIVFCMYFAGNPFFMERTWYTKNNAV